MPAIPEFEFHNARQVGTFEKIRAVLGKERQHPELLRNLVTIAYHFGLLLYETLPPRPRSSRQTFVTLRRTVAGEGELSRSDAFTVG